MQVQVERASHLGVEMPVRFRFDGREVEIVENVEVATRSSLAQIMR